MFPISNIFRVSWSIEMFCCLSSCISECDAM
jgi:hypothetical protein